MLEQEASEDGCMQQIMFTLHTVIVDGNVVYRGQNGTDAYAAVRRHLDQLTVRRIHHEIERCFRPRSPAPSSEELGKLTFRDLCDFYEISLALLAHTAGVAPHIPYLMMEGRPVARCDAEKVLAALSKYTGVTYSLDSVSIPSQEGTVY